VPNITVDLRAKTWPCFSSPSAMIIAALALRLVVMIFAYPMRLDPSLDHDAFGGEVGRVARSIATGHGFSSPFPEPTGPTAFIPPVYAYFVAGVFKLFGIYTAASAMVILTLNNLVSSLTCLPVFFIARRVFGLPVAVWSGWMWALFPYAVALSNEWVWETSLTTLLLTLLVLATFFLQYSRSLFAWIGYGLLWGFTALTNPSTLTVLPFLGAWIWLRQRRRGSNCTGVAFAASLIFLATVTPWVWRCSETFGRFVPFRSGFGLHFLAGNSGDTRTPLNLNALPNNNPDELRKLQLVGEPVYMAEKQHEAEDFIAQHPLRCAGLTLRRILYTWTNLWDFRARWTLDETGLPHILLYTFLSLLAFAGFGWAIQTGRDGVVPLAILLGCFPMIYYITYSDFRYRHAIDPVIVIFAVFGAITFRRQWARMSWERQNIGKTEQLGLRALAPSPSSQSQRVD
jgi:4-amino-4-deoxy-L-arabinose transferase-like glycosyltransferase